jgi:hypothetical protein
MSVRATSQLIGAATRQQSALELTAMISVVTNGPTKIGSETSWRKFPSVNAPSASVRL